MVMGLQQAEENRSLHIVEIQTTGLKNWLSLAGVKEGDSIWKSASIDNTSSVWTMGDWGQVIISPKIGADMLVEQASGTICTLDLIPTGHAGRFIGHKNYDACKLFWDKGNIKIGSPLHVKKKFAPLFFHIKVNGKIVRMDDETAFNIWTHEDGKWVQLGTMMVGRPFRPAIFTGCGNTKNMFAHRIGGKAPPVTIEQIIPTNSAGSKREKVVIKTLSGNRLSLAGDASQKVRVRLCDICWSCGICQ